VTTPKYGCDDGFAVRFTAREAWARYADGEWREISLTEAVCNCAVLTEAAYHERFGDELPPLPDHAFCSHWRSPLV
jgi:hypothetical protein